jgi:predicted component of type VI protein secretion system
MENPIETPSAMPETPAESSTTATRSVRTRNKSQRALEAEHLEKLMARAKAQSKDVAAVLAAESSSATVTASAKKPRVKGRKKKEVEEYCICRTSGDDGRAMIECGVCNDW